MKLFYVPNEGVEGDQLGPHATFRRMVREGELSGYAAYPLNLRTAELGLGAAQAGIAAEIQAFQPDLILISKFGLPAPARVEGMVQSWRHLAPQAFIGYHDGDPYGRLLARIPASTRDVVREVDAVFTVGLGALREAFQTAGARHIEYTPSWTDTIRFGHDQSTEKTCDAVLFGRYSKLQRLKIPFPGAGGRLRLVRRLKRDHGDRFKVYGNGYPDDVQSEGFVAYDQQERVNRSARVTASWNHFPTVPYYFSDRLPIALISGVPHVTNAFPGHERVFEGCPGVYFARTPDEAGDMVADLLWRDPEGLAAEGAAAREWVKRNLTCDVVMPRVIRRMQALKLT